MKPLFEKTTSPGQALDVVLTAAPASLPATVHSTQPAVPARPAVRRALAVLNDKEIDDLGAEAAASIAAIPGQLLKSVRAIDAGDFGHELNQIVVVAKGLDLAKFQDEGLISKALHMFSSVKERINAQYNTVDQQMGVLLTVMEKKAAGHYKHIGQLDQLYNGNVQYHQLVEKAVAKGQSRIAEVTQDMADFGAPADAFEAQQLADMQRFIDRMDMRISNLKRAMVLAKQFAPRVRLIQDNARGLIEKLSDIKTVAWPAWQNNFTTELIQLEQKDTVVVIDAIDAATDSALRRGADLLRQNTNDVARVRNRAVVSMDTLKYANDQLIGAYTDMETINAEGRAARKAAEPELLALEQSLISVFAPGHR